MALRIRCPQCRTVQRVPAGVRPVCPKCGFAGNSAKLAAEQPAATTAEGTWAQPEGEVSWETPAATAPEAAAAPEAPAGEAWAEATWPQSDAPGEAPKKKGWFGRSK